MLQNQQSQTRFSFLTSFFLTLFTFFVALMPAPSHASSPGLPFTETFADIDLQDTTITTANWNVDNEQVVLNQAQLLESPFPDDISRRFYGRSSHPESNWRIINSDFDGDGLNDIAVATGINPNGNESPSIRLYLNRNVGNTYGNNPTVSINPPNTNDDTRAIAAGDVDNDGDIDIVAGNLGLNRLFLNNNPTNPFTAFTAQALTTDNTYAIKLHDINNDQLLDLIVGNNGDNFIILNDGDTTPFDSNPPIILPDGAAHTSQIVVADLNEDGQPDLLISNRNAANQLYFHTGSSPYYSTPISIGSNNDSRDITACDLDNDGDLDIAVANYAQTNVWYRNTGGGNFAAAINLTTDISNTTGIAALEADNDGDIDLAFANDGTDNTFIVNDGTVDPFAASILQLLEDRDQPSTGIVAFDHNNDGLVDIWVSNSKTPNVGSSSRGRGYTNQVSNQNFSVFQSMILNTPIDIVDSAQRDIAIGDINRDGLLDIAVAVSGTNTSLPERNFINLHNGSSTPYSDPIVRLQNDINNSATTEAVRLADVNNDGYLDIIFGNRNRTNRLYINNKSNNPYNVTPIEFGFAEQNNSLSLADVDHDGYLDLLVGYDLVSSPPQLFLNSGSPPFFSTAIDLRDNGSNSASDTWSVHLDDINQDGTVDAITSDVNTNDLVFVNASTDAPSFANPVRFGDSDRSSISSAIVDVNRDGKKDYIAGEETLRFPDAIFINTGTPDAFLNSAPIPLGDDRRNTRFITTGDFNRNGNIELALQKDGENFLFEVSINAIGDISLIQTVLLENPNADGLESEKGDIDNDGDIDIVVVEVGDDPDNYILLNNLQPQPFIDTIQNPFLNDSSNTTDVLLIDINQNGDIDTVTTTLNSTNRFYANTETPTPFADVSPSDLPGGLNNAYGLASGDFDLDGDPDLVIAIDGDNLLLRNNDTATPFANVQPEVFGSTGETRAFAVGDIDLDGDLDVVSAEFGAPNQLILNDRSANPLGASTTIGSAATNSTDVALRDINIDGRLDLVVSNDNQTDEVYLNTGTTPYFTTALPLPSSTGRSTAVTTGDFDIDGDHDVAVATSNGTNRVYYYNRSTNTFTGNDVSLDQDSSTDIQAIDIDYDGNLDLIISNDGAPDKIYSNAGGAILFNGVTAEPVFTTSISSQALAVADVDYDGLLDIVVGANGQNFWYERGQDEVELNFNINANLAGSIEVDDTTDPILEIELLAEADLPANTSIDYFVSNNDGQIFYPIQPNVPLTFPTSGNQLRWKAKLNSCSPVVTPILKSVTLRTPSDDEPPTTSGIADVEVNEDAPDMVIDLTSAFADAETASADLIYTITTAPDSALVAASINANNELVLDYVADAFGMTTITIQAEDEANQTVSTMFWIEVNPLNDPPTADPIPPENVQEDANNSTLNLESYFSDLETAAANLTYAIVSNSNLSLFTSVNINTQNELILDYAPDANGSATIVLSATDADNATVENTLTVNVAPVNDPPQAGIIADFAVQEDAPPSVIALFPVFDDLETADAQLLLSITSNSNPALFANTTIDPNNGELTLNYAANAAGMATITLQVEDEGSLTAQTNFTVTVNAENDPPTGQAVAPITVLEDTANSTLDLFTIFNDIETPDANLTLNVSSSNAMLFNSLSIDNNGILTIDYADDAFGTAQLTLSATDTDNASTSVLVDIEVTPVNDPPSSNNPAPITVLEDAANTVINLFPFVEDIETIDSNFTFSVTNTSNLLTAQVNASGDLIIDYTDDANGQTTLTITATDEGGLNTTLNIPITITPENDGPTADSITPVNAFTTDPNKIVDLLAVFNDIETADNDLFLAIDSNNNPSLFTSITINNSGELIIDYAGITGDATLVLSATDEAGETVTTTLAITVAAAQSSGDFESNGGGGGTGGIVLLLLSLLAIAAYIRNHERVKTPPFLTMPSFKKTTRALLLIGLASSQTALADWSLQGGFGISRSYASGQSFETALNHQGHAITITGSDRTELGGYLMLGYHWKYLGLQAGVLELGDYETTFTGSTPDLDQLANDVNDIQPVGGTGAALLASLQIDLDREFRLQGKLGGVYLFGNDVELNLNNQRISRSSEAEWAPAIGLGLHYKLDDSHSIGIEALHLDIDREDVTLYSVAYQYNF